MPAFPLSRFVDHSVILENLRTFRERCTAVRIRPDLMDKDQVRALAAFHNAAVKAVGMDSLALRRDRAEVLNRIEAGQMSEDEKETTQVLASLKFKTARPSAVKPTSARPNIRSTGEIAPFSRFLEKPSIGHLDAERTRFSTYSRKSAW